MTWQPIDSAPDDGRQFLAARPVRGPELYEMDVAQHCGEQAEPWLTGILPWSDEEFRDTFTHWRELPPMPRRAR